MGLELQRCRVQVILHRPFWWLEIELLSGFVGQLGTCSREKLVPNRD